MMSKLLGSTPVVHVDVLDDRTKDTRPDEGFLRVRRLSLRNRYPDASHSRVYRYDVVERDAMDAVGIVLQALGREGRLVCLRSALRPPLSLRAGYALPLDDPRPSPVLWEIPAGLVEPDERGEEGLRRCASRETLEEVGLPVPPEAFAPLGPPVCLSPGVLAEKIHFLVATVDPASAGDPIEDGSVVEERSEACFVPLLDALEATRDGRIADAKTEVALRRLVELISGPKSGPRIAQRRGCRPQGDENRGIAPLLPALGNAADGPAPQASRREPSWTGNEFRGPR